MSIVKKDRILCFDCVRIVSSRIKDGVEHVVCPQCWQTADVEKALDDCFVYIVASEITNLSKKSHARAYRFMPLLHSQEYAEQSRILMMKAGRARRVA